VPRDLRLADKSIARPFELADRLPVDDPDRYAGPDWHPGEAGGRDRLQKFLADGLEHYDKGRDRPDIEGVSRLSPHLHFGELSPNQAWHAVRGTVSGSKLPAGADRFLSELGWRDFSYYTLYHNPDLPTTNLKRQFDRFPWREDDAALKAWQEGRTGVPFVDAGMRELRDTGYMHNRVRMVVASFLVKNLLIDWRHGARWFWDNLLDADLANNSASWQWVAGCGADAAPYFRIFNPEIQGRKFDPDGNYVRRFVPELAGTSDSAPDYPNPIVDLKMSRERALDAFKTLSGKA
jgi:deoxyribodipyrimidine photo-lyase